MRGHVLITWHFNFNPRSREGSDNTDAAKEAAEEYFNPRSREGSDEHYQNRRRSRRNFNPRSREGSDILTSVAGIPEVISIRAPARGATFRRYIAADSCMISIRAPARGATSSAGT